MQRSPIDPLDFVKILRPLTEKNKEPLSIDTGPAGSSHSIRNASSESNTQIPAVQLLISVLIYSRLFLCSHGDRIPQRCNCSKVSSGCFSRANQTTSSPNCLKRQRTATRDPKSMSKPVRVSSYKRASILPSLEDQIIQFHAVLSTTTLPATQIHTNQPK